MTRTAPLFCRLGAGRRYLHAAGLPPEANGWQQIRLLYRARNGSAKEQQDQAKLIRSLRTELTSMEVGAKRHRSPDAPLLWR